MNNFANSQFSNYQLSVFVCCFSFWGVCIKVILLRLLYIRQCLPAIVIGVCDDNMITEYISIITSMFPDLSEKDTLTFDEASSEMEWSEDTQVNDVLSLSQMRAECVRIVNSPSHVNRFLGIVRSRSSDETLLQVARLCHILTSQMGQMVHSNR